MKEPNFSKMVHKTIRLKGPDKTLHLIHICKLINQLCISNYPTRKIHACDVCMSDTPYHRLRRHIIGNYIVSKRYKLKCCIQTLQA